MEYKIKELKVSDIKPDKNQPRKTFDDEELQHLAESILGNGLLNPIEVDEDYIITDGERRWRASKIAGLKTVTVRIVANKDKTEKLRRQLIFSLQDEEIPTEEKYSAIVKLYEIELSKGPLVKVDWCKKLGIEVTTLNQAMQYCNFVEEEPEIAKKVAPHIIIETASLPKEERKEVLKEFEGTKDKKKDLIRELVKVKKKEVEDKKIIAELREKSEELAKSKQFEIKVTNTQDVINEIREGIVNTHKELSSLMSRIKSIRRTKFYLYKAKQKEDFIRFLDGASDRARRWADELDDLKDTIEIEIIRE